MSIRACTNNSFSAFVADADFAEFRPELVTRYDSDFPDNSCFAVAPRAPKSNILRRCARKSALRRDR